MIFNAIDTDMFPVGPDFEATIEIREKQTGKRVYRRSCSFPDVFEKISMDAREEWEKADQDWIGAVERAKQNEKTLKEQKEKENARKEAREARKKYIEENEGYLYDEWVDRSLA